MLTDIKETFDKYEYEFLRINRVQEVLPSIRRDICAFIRLEKLTPHQKDNIVGGADHDIIYLDVDMEEFKKNATEDDVLYLTRCGVMYNDNDNSFEMFA